MEDNQSLEVKINSTLLFVDEKPDIQTLQLKQEPGIASSTFHHGSSLASQKQDFFGKWKGTGHNDNFYDVIVKRDPAKIACQDKHPGQDKQIIEEETFYSHFLSKTAGAFSSCEELESDPGSFDEAKKVSKLNGPSVSPIAEIEDPLCIKALKVKVEADSSLVYTVKRFKKTKGTKSSQSKVLHPDEHFPGQMLLLPSSSYLTDFAQYGSLDNTSQTKKESQESLTNFCMDKEMHYAQKENFKINLKSETSKKILKPLIVNRQGQKHLAVRQYICDMCNKVFKKKSYLNQHILFHLRNTVYKVGSTGFKHKTFWEGHKGLDPLLKPFVCNVCDKGFKQVSHLNRHKMVHLSVKPFICDECNKSFRQKTHLEQHKLIHLSVKPYTCDVCNKGFRQRTHLTQHQLIHLSLKPFTCDVCYKDFRRRTHLNQHKLFIH